jgi:hypothetical protein
MKPLPPSVRTAYRRHRFRRAHNKRHDEMPKAAQNKALRPRRALNLLAIC